MSDKIIELVTPNYGTRRVKEDALSLLIENWSKQRDNLDELIKAGKEALSPKRKNRTKKG